MAVILSFSLPDVNLDGTSWNTTSFPSHGNAPNGTTATHYESIASWNNAPRHDATNGSTSNGTGERQLIKISNIHVNVGLVKTSCCQSA